MIGKAVEGSDELMHPNEKFFELFPDVLPLAAPSSGSPAKRGGGSLLLLDAMRTGKGDVRLFLALRFGFEKELKRAFGLFPKVLAAMLFAALAKASGARSIGEWCASHAAPAALDDSQAAALCEALGSTGKCEKCLKLACMCPEWAVEDPIPELEDMPEFIPQALLFELPCRSASSAPPGGDGPTEWLWHWCEWDQPGMFDRGTRKICRTWRNRSYAAHFLADGNPEAKDLERLVYHRLFIATRSGEACFEPGYEPFAAALKSLSKNICAWENWRGDSQCFCAVKEVRSNPRYLMSSLRFVVLLDPAARAKELRRLAAAIESAQRAWLESGLPPPASLGGCFLKAKRGAPLQVRRAAVSRRMRACGFTVFATNLHMLQEEEIAATAVRRAWRARKAVLAALEAPSLIAPLKAEAGVPPERMAAAEEGERIIRFAAIFALNEAMKRLEKAGREAEDGGADSIPASCALSWEALLEKLDDIRIAQPAGGLPAVEANLREAALLRRLGLAKPLQDPNELLSLLKPIPPEIETDLSAAAKK